METPCLIKDLLLLYPTIYCFTISTWFVIGCYNNRVPLVSKEMLEMLATLDQRLVCFKVKDNLKDEFNALWKLTNPTFGGSNDVMWRHDKQKLCFHILQSEIRALYLMLSCFTVSLIIQRNSKGDFPPFLYHVGGMSLHIHPRANRVHHENSSRFQCFDEWWVSCLKPVKNARFKKKRWIWT